MKRSVVETILGDEGIGVAVMVLMFSYRVADRSEERSVGKGRSSR